MNNYLLIGVGAMLGALLRFLISLGTMSLAVPFFTGTLLVNVAGALLIGFLVAKELAPGKYGFWVKGFLGSFTTFSLLSYEMYLLLSYGDILVFIIYLAINLFLGLISVFLGFTLGGKKLNA